MSVKLKNVKELWYYDAEWIVHMDAGRMMTHEKDDHDSSAKILADIIIDALEKLELRLD